MADELGIPVVDAEALIADLIAAGCSSASLCTELAAIATTKHSSSIQRGATPRLDCGASRGDKIALGAQRFDPFEVVLLGDGNLGAEINQMRFQALALSSVSLITVW